MSLQAQRDLVQHHRVRQDHLHLKNEYHCIEALGSRGAWPTTLATCKQSKKSYKTTPIKGLCSQVRNRRKAQS